jgi:hypothetical protein
MKTFVVMSRKGGEAAHSLPWKKKKVNHMGRPYVESFSLSWECWSLFSFSLFRGHLSALFFLPVLSVLLIFRGCLSELFVIVMIPVCHSHHHFPITHRGRILSGV